MQEYAVETAKSDKFYVILAFDGGKPVGMSGCVQTEDFGKTVMVWVDPEYRGQHIGRLLVAKTMEVAGLRHYKLTVVDGSMPAIRTYEDLGFRANGFSYTNINGFREIEMVLDREHDK